MTRVCRRWTKEEDGIILDYANKGFTYKEISPIVDRTVLSLDGRLKYLGFQRIKHWSLEEVDLLKDYINQGLSHLEISKKMNRTVAAIERQCHNYQLLLSPQWSKDDDDLLRSYLDKYSYIEIATKLKKTISSIYHRCHRLNISPKNVTKSKMEFIVIYLLNKNNIAYKKEKTFDHCKDKAKLRFDFYIINKNMCIECQGIQHYPKRYKKSQYIHTERAKYLNIEKIQLHDKIKNSFCKKNKIKLIKIPYWNINKIEEILAKNCII